MKNDLMLRVARQQRSDEVERLITLLIKYTNPHRILECYGVYFCLTSLFSKHLPVRRCSDETTEIMGLQTLIRCPTPVHRPRVPPVRWGQCGGNALAFRLHSSHGGERFRALAPGLSSGFVVHFGQFFPPVTGCFLKEMSRFFSPSCG